ncbi:MAG: hypothetical protein LBJ08_02730, partial [Bifidobacteriaceae bacterium]|nr:hypothetical protein [Bifidobacteriaceae bacterium]
QRLGGTGSGARHYTVPILAVLAVIVAGVNMVIGGYRADASPSGLPGWHLGLNWGILGASIVAAVAVGLRWMHGVSKVAMWVCVGLLALGVAMVLLTAAVSSLVPAGL